MKMTVLWNFLDFFRLFMRKTAIYIIKLPNKVQKLRKESLARRVDLALPYDLPYEVSRRAFDTDETFAYKARLRE